jgi:hypothetical protein
MVYQRKALSAGAIERFRLLREIGERIEAGRVLEAAEIATSPKVKEPDLRRFMPRVLVHAGYYRMTGSEQRVQTLMSAFHLREEDIVGEASKQADSRLGKTQYKVHFDP